jgi:hypothetical protein
MASIVDRCRAAELRKPARPWPKSDEYWGEFVLNRFASIQRMDFARFPV